MAKFRTEATHSFPIFRKYGIPYNREVVIGRFCTENTDYFQNRDLYGFPYLYGRMESLVNYKNKKTE